MNWMFCNCSSLRDIDLTDFNSQNVNDMHCMFSGCSSLKNINLSYFNTDDENLNNLRQYTTKSVIFSNYIDKLDKSINYINLSYLGAYVYSHLNIKDKDYYNFVNNTRKEMPVFSRHFVYDINTKRFIDIDKLDKNYKKLYNNLRNVQYYEFFDKK